MDCVLRVPIRRNVLQRFANRFGEKAFEHAPKPTEGEVVGTWLACECSLRALPLWTDPLRYRSPPLARVACASPLFLVTANEATVPVQCARVCGLILMLIGCSVQGGKGRSSVDI